MPRRMIEVRDSPVHGRGVFATREIPRGTTVIEYTGECISWDEADRREELKDDNDTHTMLFTVDKKTVIDASQRGSDARVAGRRELRAHPSVEECGQERREVAGGGRREHRFSVRHRT